MHWFIIGCCFGSFICACAFRYENVMLKPFLQSVCPACHQRIAWYDLIPVLSWLILKGKCRQCHASIPVDHIVCELLTGTLFLWIGQKVSETEILFKLAITCVLLYAAWTDGYYGLIPDRCHLFLLLIFFIHPNELKISSIFFSLIVLIVLGILASLSQSMGFGDVKLIAACTLFLTWIELAQLMCIASNTALLCQIPSFIQHKKRDKIRFAPYLTFSALLILLDFL